MSDTAPQYSFWIEEKLRNADTDQQGHINNAVMSSFFEGGRIEVLAHPSAQAFLKTASIVVVRVLINFKKELFYPGTIRVGTNVPRIGRTSLDFQHCILGPDGEVANGEATCVFIDRQSRKPVPVPEDLRSYLMGS